MKLLRRIYDALELGKDNFISRKYDGLGNYDPLTDPKIEYYPPRTLEELDTIEKKLIPPKISTKF